MKSQRSGTQRDSAFTFTELLLVIAIIAMLIGLLMPALRGAREKALDVTCMNNLRQVATGLNGYAIERGALPQRFNYGDPDHNWGYDDHLIRAEMVVRGNGGGVFVCPRHPESNYDAATHSEPSYGMNWYYDNTSLDVVERGDTILVADTYGPKGKGSHRADRDEFTGIGLGALDIFRHGPGSGYAYFDTHVEMTGYEKASDGAVAGDGARWGVDQGDHDRHVWPVP